MPFRWSYSLVQGGGALGGFLLGATVGVGTVAVVLALGPLVGLSRWLMRLDVHQITLVRRGAPGGRNVTRLGWPA